ncbi:hypothetical protein M011DRAFT_424134 [Sporormia fimetaria CBS 119925]|uniref:Vacuolar protein sorting-associated protein 62 n=1 Tax=Sporormia fimetaria CBS 119925 TaxID=1340428 RepID=A0A6A6VB67_9PLEO|nr:hypothetical protein M011DRAFT_424134 [Sporormia fimetaria CBS 119925]
MPIIPAVQYQSAQSPLHRLVDPPSISITSSSTLLPTQAPVAAYSDSAAPYIYTPVENALSDASKLTIDVTPKPSLDTGSNPARPSGSHSILSSQSILSGSALRQLFNGLVVAIIQFKQTVFQIVDSDAPAQVKAEQSIPSTNKFWESGAERPDLWSNEERQLRQIPDYVLEYAPYIYLYSQEEFWPCDVGDHLIHTTPHLNYTALRAVEDHPALNDLDDLNLWGGFVYLQSDENVEDRPDWLGGKKNIPSVPKDSKEERIGGKSDAPVVLIVVQKDDGIVDAFFFFFYSYNLGNKVFNVRFGNHVGDWEHTLVRFQNGEPIGIFFSEHSHGEAYRFDVVSTIGKRPVGYSAVGSHAMYASPGDHPYGIPGGVLRDLTDQGPLWDPTLNLKSYTYDYRHDVLRSSTLNPSAPTEWFHYVGRWGDKMYPMSDPRQYRFMDEYHYVDGPLGPKFKNLGRRDICQSGPECKLILSVEEWDQHCRNETCHLWELPGQGEDMSETDYLRFGGPESTNGR